METNNNRPVYITVVENFTLLTDVTYVVKQQFLFIRTEIGLPNYKGCTTTGYEKFYVGVDCNENEIMFPSKFTMLTNECINPEYVNTFNYLQSKFMDKSSDYYADYLSATGVDMRDNHVMQVDERFYTALDLIPPGRKNVKGRGQSEETLSFDKD